MSISLCDGKKLNSLISGRPQELAETLQRERTDHRPHVTLNSERRTEGCLPDLLIMEGEKVLTW